MKKKSINASTKICYEQPCEDNPYQAEKLYVAGYDIEDLTQSHNSIDLIFLMFTGDLSKTPEDKSLLQSLQTLLALPSPRHPAARAAMNSGICKTNEEHLLPIALMTLGGSQSGALEVKAAMEFIKANISVDPKRLADDLAKHWLDKKSHIAAGFGQLFGDPDKLSLSFFNKLSNIKPQGKTIRWVNEFITQLAKYNAGILDVGLAACIFHQLSFSSRESVGLYQLFRAPGLLAYAMEQTHNPLSGIPMLGDDQYELTTK